MLLLLMAVIRVASTSASKCVLRRILLQLGEGWHVESVSIRLELIPTIVMVEGSRHLLLEHVLLLLSWIMMVEHIVAPLSLHVLVLKAHLETL